MLRKGFTLVELLVVVLIIAILAAIALPLYLSAVADSERKTARANMQTIANADCAYQVRGLDGQYTTSLVALAPDLGNDYTNIGPGTSRTYAIVLSPTSTTCTDGSGGTINVQGGSFYVSDGISTDGCFTPSDTAH